MLTHTKRYPWTPFENENTEFKEKWCESARTTLIAFANTFGGRIYFGVNDAGEPVGIDDYDETARSVMNFVRNGVDPDMSALVTVTPLVVDGKTIAEATVSLGDDRPYSFRGKNWLFGGVFVRIGSSSMQASRAEIMRMSGDSIPWEERICRNQELTFHEAEKICAERGTAFGPKYFVGYGLTDTMNRFTNLALLVSDQNPEKVSVNRFTGEGGRLEECREFEGSILRQRTDALSYLRELNRPVMQKTIDAAERLDQYPWPPIAVREALTNCLVHHEFGTDFTSPTAVNLFADRLVFQTVSSLPFNVTVEDLYIDGFSFCRNNRLAELFHRLGWMEKVGSGFTEIFAGYAASVRKPSCSTTGRIFRITLPKLTVEGTPAERIIELLRTTPGLGRKDLEEALGLAKTAVATELRKLVESELVERLGTARSTRYRLRPGA